MVAWQIQRAKARFSELLRRAEAEGPQTITRHGRERAVVLSIDDYRRLVGSRPDLRAHLLTGPTVEDLDVRRDPDVGREIEL